MRALLANMTTMSRLSPFFQERTVAEDATFFDLLKLLGFRELTITDGEKADASGDDQVAPTPPPYAAAALDHQARAGGRSGLRGCDDSAPALSTGAAAG